MFPFFARVSLNVHGCVALPLYRDDTQSYVFIVYEMGVHLAFILSGHLGESLQHLIDLCYV